MIVPRLPATGKVNRDCRFAVCRQFCQRLTRALGSNCSPRRWKLDRSQRSFDARLGSSNTLGHSSPERLPSLFSVVVSFDQDGKISPLEGSSRAHRLVPFYKQGVTRTGK
jgi:hypothetical protein